MRSTSSICKFYILNSKSIGARFTAKELFNEIKPTLPPDQSFTLGGVGGFLSRAATADCLFAVNIDGEYQYSKVDPDKLAAMPIRESAGAGSTSGRGDGPHRKPLPTTQSIQARLLDLAAELELARTPLSTYSSEELLAELTRRQRATVK